MQTHCAWARSLGAKRFLELGHVFDGVDPFFAEPALAAEIPRHSDESREETPSDHDGVFRSKGANVARDTNDVDTVALGTRLGIFHIVILPRDVGNALK